MEFSDITFNERSWAIELISKINEIASANDLKIKKAGSYLPTLSRK